MILIIIKTTFKSKIQMMSTEQMWYNMVRDEWLDHVLFRLWIIFGLIGTVLHESPGPCR